MKKCEYVSVLPRLVLCSVINCSQDFGKTLTQMRVPYNASVESLTAGMVGLWVAIHIANPNNQQHEVHCGTLILITLTLLPSFVRSFLRNGGRPLAVF